jgi:protoporphyrinogen IX oxidase
VVEFYPWIKAAHVFAVVSWMAGLLYLPRLMVYHCKATVGGEASELFKVMERRLLRGIMGPAMIASWVFGLWLVHLYGSVEAWLIGKLACVIVLTVFHMWMAGFVRAFAADGRPRSERFFRLVNEIPAVLMAVILVLVLVKPFL